MRRTRHIQLHRDRRELDCVPRKWSGIANVYVDGALKGQIDTLCQSHPRRKRKRIRFPVWQWAITHS